MGFPCGSAERIHLQCGRPWFDPWVGKVPWRRERLPTPEGTFHAKMGSIKDRNGMDLTEAEDIKKRWQEYTEELYKKDPQTQIITMV